jgi:hypothetical protein
MPEAPKKRVIMSISRSMVSMDASGRGLHFMPSQRLELSEAEAASPQVQKLLRSKFLVDVTAAGEKRKAWAK